jgi:hypothetical protein
MWGEFIDNQTFQALVQACFPGLQDNELVRALPHSTLRLEPSTHFYESVVETQEGVKLIAVPFIMRVVLQRTAYLFWQYPVLDQFLVSLQIWPQSNFDFLFQLLLKRQCAHREWSASHMAV